MDWPIAKASSNSQTQMPSSPSSAGTPESEKSQQLSAVGHHAEHPYPYGVGEGASQGDEPLYVSSAMPLRRPPFSSHDSESFAAHSVPCSAGLRPLMKALASGTSSPRRVTVVAAATRVAAAPGTTAADPVS